MPQAPGGRTCRAGVRVGANHIVGVDARPKGARARVVRCSTTREMTIRINEIAAATRSCTPIPTSRSRGVSEARIGSAGGQAFRHFHHDEAGGLQRPEPGSHQPPEELARGVRELPRCPRPLAERPDCEGRHREGHELDEQPDRIGETRGRSRRSHALAPPRMGRRRDRRSCGRRTRRPPLPSGGASRGRSGVSSHRTQDTARRKLSSARRLLHEVADLLLLAGVSSISANEVGHIPPLSRLASSLKPSVAYLDLNFCASWKKQRTLSSLA